MRIKLSYKIICRTLLYGAVIFCFLFPTSKAHSQILANAYSNANSAINSFFSEDIPGAFNAAMPLLFPPYLGGEIRIRPVSMNLMNGEVLDEYENKWVDLEVGDRGISLSSKGAFIETMLRLQFSRLSLRTQYNADIRRIPAGDGYVNWLNWRFGADLDIINSYGLRVGPAIDYYTERPYVKFGGKQRPRTSLGKDVSEVIAYAPATIGFYASYNPFTSWVVSPTAEIRFQWPWPYRSDKSLRAKPAQLTEWEYAIGLKLPKTVLGSTGLRIGYMETKLEFSGSDQSSTYVPVKLQWSGLFGELVWFY